MCLFEVVERIQELSPSAAVSYRIRRLLGLPIDSELFDNFYNSKWVEVLRKNQLDDGGYGRFHSQDSKIKRRFTTTEKAVDSIKMLDIQRGNSLVDKLCDYMERILTHKNNWPDGFENNKWYRPAQPLFVSTKLSIFGSDCKAYHEIFDCWHAILKEAFCDGNYNVYRTNKISKDLLGCQIDGSYIGLNSIYLIEFFGNMQDKIDNDLKLNYLRWLHQSGKNIYYTKLALNQKFNSNYSEMFKVYYLLSKFTGYKSEFEEELSWLKSQRSPEGFWNFGKNFSCQRFSDDWRSLEKMNIDHTIMALLLLK